MVHIAQCECFYEQNYYTPSEEGFQVFDTSLGKIGIVVCFDRHYPESIRIDDKRVNRVYVYDKFVPLCNVTERKSIVYSVDGTKPK